MTRRPPRSTRTGHLFPHTTLFRSDSLATVLALETGHGPVYYFPREDVRMDLLARTDHRTRCPYKGDASYWTLRAGDRRIENAVWSYKQPITGAEAIEGRLAFYWDRVDRKSTRLNSSH